MRKLGSKKEFDDTSAREFSKLVKKDLQIFLDELNKIQSSISRVYELNASKARSSNRYTLYKNACGAISKFADLTDQLHEKLSQESLEKEVELEKRWIVTAKQVVDMLKNNTLAYTTYEDSLGMPSDESVSNLFLNFKGSKDVKKPYFPTAFCRASDILFKNGEFEYAERYSLIAAVEALWDMYHYEKDDVYEALMQIPWSLEGQGKNDEATEYIIKMLNWLYEFYIEWGLQEAADTFILMLSQELINRWETINHRMKEKVAKFWEESIRIVVEVFKGWLVFDDYMISNLVDILVKSSMHERAFRIVDARIEALVSHAVNYKDFTTLKSNQLLQSLKYLARAGFDLKDRKIQSLNENLRSLRSIYLEDRVSKLAGYMGYSQEGYRVWKFKDQTLKQFMKNNHTTTIEIDIHRSKSEHVRGKERKILFIAECKYRNKLATLKDVRFFFYKAKDLLNREKDSVKHLPSKMLPKIGELWFVSANGFRKNVFSKVFRIGDCVLKPMEIAELNKMLKKNNLQLIPGG